MEPFEKVRAEDKAWTELSKQKNTTCKNAEFRLELKTNDPKKLKFEYEILNSGCFNDRRNGSAYCQECSDNYKK